MVARPFLFGQPMFSTDQILAFLADLPTTAEWPALLDAVAVRGQPTNTDWQLPWLGCVASGGAAEQALPAVAAVACVYRSIILVDDLLDEDPKGRHHEWGVGRTANLALALQALGSEALERLDAAPERRATAVQLVNRLCLETAYGQQMDAANLVGEAAYWRNVQAKSTPFYAAALALGGVAAGAPSAVVDGLRANGALLGEIVQLNDDLEDALQTPANPDWVLGRNNLLILFAATADHPERARFEALRPQHADPAVLAELQQILVRSGALSYTIYQMVRRYQRALAQVRDLHLPNPEPLRALWRQYPLGIQDLFARLSIPIALEALLEE